jgi:hypothetical protein
VNLNDIAKRLAEPFPDASIGMKPQSVKGNRALVVFYCDARDVMDRLDAVIGIGSWQDDYELLPDGSVICRLKICVEDRWITKTDVGSPSEQPDGGDRLKAAFSDALKRAAVKYGIGRYLYSMPNLWADYDPVKRCFTDEKVILNQLPKQFRRANQAFPPQPPQPPARQVTRDDVWNAVVGLAKVRKCQPQDVWSKLTSYCSKITGLSNIQSIDDVPLKFLAQIYNTVNERTQAESTS